MSSSTIPLFGYAYNLQVLTPPDSSGNQSLITYSTDAWEPEALRITFDVTKQWMRNAWYADIAIYNLSAQSEQNAIQVGSQVILSAGFQVGSNYGIIFSGQVLQPTWERINATDYKVGLRCVVGPNYMNNNLIAANIAKRSSQADLVRRMAAQARQPFETDLIDFTAMDQRPLPRGQVIFGSVASFFEDIAADNSAHFWVAGDRPGYGKVSDNMATVTPIAIYAPPLPVDSTYQQQANVTYSILGTPQQTSGGVSLRVLLDPRVDFRKGTFTAIQITMSQIAQQSISIGETLPQPFEQSGTYYVIGIRHVGDSRGNDWYTEIDCMTSLALQTYFGV